MRRLAVVELVLLLLLFLLAAVLSALLLLLLLCRRRSSSSSKPTQLPVSEEPQRAPLPSRPASKEERLLLRRVLLALRLCLRFRGRTRVEPAGTTTPAPDARGSPEDQEDVAAWRERWFGPGHAAATSRALYTIDEEEEPSTTSDGESEGVEHHQEEPETPFYTPPASPAAGGLDLT